MKRGWRKQAQASLDWWVDDEIRVYWRSAGQYSKGWNIVGAGYQTDDNWGRRPNCYVVMRRLLIIALLTAMAFFGITLSGAGVHFWFAASRTTVTFLDTLQSTEDADGLRCGTPDPLFDSDFLLQRIAAAAVVAFGVSLFCWAVVLMKQKNEYDTAT